MGSPETGSDWPELSEQPAQVEEPEVLRVDGVPQKIVTRGGDRPMIDPVDTQWSEPLPPNLPEGVFYVFAEEEGRVLVGPVQDRRLVWGWVDTDAVIRWNTRDVQVDTENQIVSYGANRDQLDDQREWRSAKYYDAVELDAALEALFELQVALLDETRYVITPNLAKRLGQYSTANTSDLLDTRLIEECLNWLQQPGDLSVREMHASSAKWYAKLSTSVERQVAKLSMVKGMKPVDKVHVSYGPGETGEVEILLVPQTAP